MSQVAAYLRLIPPQNKALPARGQAFFAPFLPLFGTFQIGGNENVCSNRLVLHFPSSCIELDRLETSHEAGNWDQDELTN